MRSLIRHSIILQNLCNRFYVVSTGLFPPFIFPRALKNCLVGNFSEGARLPQWPSLNLAPSTLGDYSLYTFLLQAGIDI
jgi:hypothetical protein